MLKPILKLLVFFFFYILKGGIFIIKKAELSSNYTGRAVNTIKPTKEVKFSNKQIKAKEVWIGVFLEKL